MSPIVRGTVKVHYGDNHDLFFFLGVQDTIGEAADQFSSDSVSLDRICPGFVRDVVSFPFDRG